MNTVFKVYERIKNKKANKSSMQTSGRKNRTTIDNLIIMNAINEKQRQDHKNTYVFYADAKENALTNSG